MKNYIVFTLITVILLQPGLVESRCSFKAFTNVYNYSINALANGNFIFFYYQYSNPNLSYALYNENGTSLKNGTLRTFSSVNQSTVASGGFPDGRIILCYKENGTTEPRVEFRDQDLKLISGPFKSSTNKANRCHKIAILGYINFAIIYVNDDYKSMDYYMSDKGRKFGYSQLTSKLGHISVKSNKTDIYLLHFPNYIARLSVLSSDGATEGMYYTYPVSRTLDLHVSEKANELIMTYVSSSDTYGYLRVINGAPSSTLNTRKSFYYGSVSNNHASSANQNGNVLMCMGYLVYYCFIYKNTSMAMTDYFVIYSIIYESKITSLPSGKFVFSGWGVNDKTLSFVIFGADGVCNTTDYASNTSCPQPNTKCLNLEEISFFMGCTNGFYSFNLTCLTTCPPETVVDIPNGKCVGIPKGYYESIPLKMLLVCPTSCLSCIRYGYMNWTGFEDLCAYAVNDPNLPIYTFWINDGIRGGMNLRANGQYIIPFLNLKSVIMKLDIAMLSTDTGEVSVASLDSGMCNNQPIGSSYLSLSDGAFAVLVDCFIEQKILVFDSAMNKSCSMIVSFDAETSQDPQFINVNDSFAFLGKKNNNLMVTFFSVDKNYNCYSSSSDSIYPSDPNKNITSSSFAYLTKSDEIAITWTEFDVFDLTYQVLMTSMDLKGAISAPITNCTQIDLHPIISTKIIEAINIGFIVIWTVRDLNTSFYSIAKQEFDYQRNLLSSSFVESDLPSDPLFPSIITLPGQNHAIGWIYYSASSNLST